MRLLYYKRKDRSGGRGPGTSFTIAELDCIYTHMAIRLGERLGDGGEIWLYNKQHETEHNYTATFVERWGRWLNAPSFNPEIVLIHGNLKIYQNPMSRTPGAIRVMFIDGTQPKRLGNIDLIWIDDERQRKSCQRVYPEARIELFIKPALDSLFRPVATPVKDIDVLFAGGIRSHQLGPMRKLLRCLSKHISITHVGPPQIKMRKHPKLRVLGNKMRWEMPELYSRAKCFIYLGHGSCPRVVPEALACGCPVLALRELPLWHEKYIVSKTGMLCDDLTDMADKIHWMQSHYTEFDPHQHYMQTLSFEHAYSRFESVVLEVLEKKYGRS
jgi:glycosyltransferase involved in cell wall biosynthesis